MLWLIVIACLLIYYSNNRRNSDPPQIQGQSPIPQQTFSSQSGKVKPQVIDGGFNSQPTHWANANENPTAAGKAKKSKGSRIKTEIAKYIFGGLAALTGFVEFFDSLAVGLTLNTLLSVSLPALIVLVMGILVILWGVRNTKMYSICESVVKKNGNTSIDEIAAAVKKDYDATVSMLSTMLKKNYFPGAYIDYGNRTLVMTKDGEPIKPVEPVRPKEEKKKPAKAGELSEREKYLGEIDRLAKRVDEHEFQAKLSELRSISESIYDRIEKEPAMMADFRKFYNIYMPAIVNAVETYESVRTANYEIDETIESRKDALSAIEIGTNASKKLLGKMYAGDQMNVAADLEMLKKMLAADGLLKTDEKLTVDMFHEVAKKKSENEIPDLAEAFEKDLVN